MKITVSVPDDRWDLALRTSTVGPSPSAIVQDALRRMATPLEPRKRPALDPDMQSLFEQAQQTIRQDAEAVYARGYRSGIKLAARLSAWSEMKDILEVGINASVRAEHERILGARSRSGEAADYHAGKLLFARDLRGEDAQPGADDDDGISYEELDRRTEDVFSELIWIETTGDVIAGSLELGPLLVAGGEQALRDIFAAASPRND